jgi:hypothetical protein
MWYGRQLAIQQHIKAGRPLLDQRSLRGAQVIAHAVKWFALGYSWDDLIENGT